MSGSSESTRESFPVSPEDLARDPNLALLTMVPGYDRHERVSFVELEGVIAEIERALGLSGPERPPLAMLIARAQGRYARLTLAQCQDPCFPVLRARMAAAIYAERVGESPPARAHVRPHS